MGTCIVRKLFEYIFSQRELKWLDDLMPEDKKMAKEDQEKAEEDEVCNTLIEQCKCRNQTQRKKKGHEIY